MHKEYETDHLVSHDVVARQVITTEIGILLRRYRLAPSKEASLSEKPVLPFSHLQVVIDVEPVSTAPFIMCVDGSYVLIRPDIVMCIAEGGESFCTDAQAGILQDKYAYRFFADVLAPDQVASLVEASTVTVSDPGLRYIVAGERHAQPIKDLDLSCLPVIHFGEQERRLKQRFLPNIWNEVQQRLAMSQTVEGQYVFPLDAPLSSKLRERRLNSWSAEGAKIVKVNGIQYKVQPTQAFSVDGYDYFGVEVYKLNTAPTGSAAGKNRLAVNEAGNWRVARIWADVDRISDLDLKRRLTALLVAHRLNGVSAGSNTELISALEEARDWYFWNTNDQLPHALLALLASLEHISGVNGVVA